MSLKRDYSSEHEGTWVDKVRANATIKYDNLKKKQKNKKQNHEKQKTSEQFIIRTSETQKKTLFQIKFYWRRLENKQAETVQIKETTKIRIVKKEKKD